MSAAVDGLRVARKLIEDAVIEAYNNAEAEE